MSQARNWWIILIILAVAVVAVAVIVPMVILSDYNDAIAEIGEQATPPTIEVSPTPSLTPTPQVALVATDSPIQTEPIVTPSKNCTYTAVYWVYNPESWPSQVIIGSLNYTKQEASRIIAITGQDIPALLFLQLHAAYLNINGGADPRAVEEAMIDASDWLEEHPVGSVVLPADLSQGFFLAKILDQYNNGELGPGHCSDEPSALTYFALKTPVPLLQITLARITVTLPVTPTPTSTYTSTPPPVTLAPTTIPAPTNTKKPDEPKPKPTQPPPEPTKPPPEPTEKPKPTNPPPPTSEAGGS